MPTPSETIRAAIAAVAKVKAQEDLSLRELLDAEVRLQAIAKALERATERLEPHVRGPQSVCETGIYFCASCGLEFPCPEAVALREIAALLEAK
jgi:hypothetical protein